MAMSKRDAIKETLDRNGLISEGSDLILKKRLKNLKSKKRRLHHEVNHLAVLDFSVTDWTKLDALNGVEIIEISAIMIDLAHKEITDDFHEYARPTKNPILTEECKKYTGITQESVDQAEIFPLVFMKLLQWLDDNDAFNSHLGIMSNGSENVDFLMSQFVISEVPLDNGFRNWFNLKIEYLNLYHTNQFKFENILKELEIQRVGTKQTGMEYVTNIAAVVMTMLEDGMVLRKCNVINL